MAEHPAKSLRQRLLAYSLRASLLGVIIVACLMGWYASRVRAQRAAIRAILRSGGSFQYDYMYRGNPYETPYDANRTSRVPVWLRRALGDDFFHSVVWVRVEESDFGDEGLKAMRTLGNLKDVAIYRSRITDAGLENFKGMHLRTLWLGGNPITDAGLDALGADLLSSLETLEFRDTAMTPAKVAKIHASYPRLTIIQSGPAPGRRNDHAPAMLGPSVP